MPTLSFKPYHGSVVFSWRSVLLHFILSKTHFLNELPFKLSLLQLSFAGAFLFFGSPRSELSTFSSGSVIIEQQCLAYNNLCALPNTPELTLLVPPPRPPQCPQGLILPLRPTLYEEKSVTFKTVTGSYKCI